MVSRNVKFNNQGFLDSSIWYYKDKCPGCQQDISIVWYDQFNLVKLSGEKHINQADVYVYEKKNINLNFGINMLCEVSNKLFKGKPACHQVIWLK